MPERPTPQYVCHECGTQFCRTTPNPGATWHLGACECCLSVNVPCAEARDYGGFKRWPLPEGVDPVPRLKTLDDLIAPVINNFDFERVYKAMKELHWHWAKGDGLGATVPSIDQMKATARQLLVNVVNSHEYSLTGTGGFWAEKSTGNKDPLDNGLILRFVLEESEWYFGDFEP